MNKSNNNDDNNNINNNNNNINNNNINNNNNDNNEKISYFEVFVPKTIEFRGADFRDLANFVLFRAI